MDMCCVGDNSKCYLFGSWLFMFSVIVVIANRDSLKKFYNAIDKISNDFLDARVI